jgi:hypothetical protein
MLPIPDAFGVWSFGSVWDVALKANTDCNRHTRMKDVNGKAVLDQG